MGRDRTIANLRLKHKMSKSLVLWMGRDQEDCIEVESSFESLNPWYGGWGGIIAKANDIQSYKMSKSLVWWMWRDLQH